jgi:hypothetical protein
MEEIWKDIPNYEGRYQASSHGRIRSLDMLQQYTRKGIPVVRQRSGKMLNETKGYYGQTKREYYTARMPERSVFIHILVAKTFIPNPDNKPFINHIDRNGLNNHVDNLEWNTNRENQIHGFLKRGNKGSKYPGVSPNSKGFKAQVYVNKKCIHIGTFKTEEEAAQAYRDKLDELGIKTKY